MNDIALPKYLSDAMVRIIAAGDPLACRGSNVLNPSRLLDHGVITVPDHDAVHRVSAIMYEFTY